MDFGACLSSSAFCWSWGGGFAAQYCGKAMPFRPEVPVKFSSFFSARLSLAEKKAKHF
jgi:hypothetical protein